MRQHKMSFLYFLLLAHGYILSPGATAQAGWVALHDKNGSEIRNVPDEANEQLKTLAKQGVQIKSLSFTPDGGWVIISDKNVVSARNIPDEAFKKLGDLAKQGSEIKSITFTQGGGWAILYDKNNIFTRNIPDEAYKKLGELAKEGAELKSITFTPEGGWCILHDKNAATARNIPDDAFKKLGELAKQGVEIKSVSLVANGGWVIIHEKNSFTSNNLPDDAFKKLGELAKQGVELKGISFTIELALSKLSSDDKATRQKVLDRMAHYKVPGMSLVIIEDGKILHARGYGVVQVGGKAVTAETRFQAGSISKPVTALAALRLVHDGKLDLDAEIKKYLVAWKIPENEFTKQKQPTVRQVLSHSGGFNIHGFGGYAESNKAPNLLQVLEGKPPAGSPRITVEFTPGSKVKYSGGGYCVLQQAMVDVSKKPFPTLMNDLILKPTGMASSTFEQPLPKTLEPLAAVGHKNGTAVPAKWHTYPEMAAAGLWATPSDLARCALAVQRSATGQTNALLNAKLTKELFTAPMDNQALGFQVAGQGKQLVFSHTGINEGFHCRLVASAETGHGVVIMTNANGASGLLDEVVQAVRREYGW